MLTVIHTKHHCLSQYPLNSPTWSLLLKLKCEMFPWGSCVWPAAPLLDADLAVGLSWRTWCFHSLGHLLPDFRCSMTRCLTLLPGAFPTRWTVKPWTVSQRPSLKYFLPGTFHNKKSSCYALTSLPALPSTVPLSMSRDLPFLARSVKWDPAVGSFLCMTSLTYSFQGLSGIGASL